MYNMVLYEYLVCFALYVVAFVFLFKTYSELISLLLIAIIHFVFMGISIKDLYKWYNSLIGKKSPFLKLILFIITISYFTNFIALVLIVVALLYLKATYNKVRGTELYLSPKNRIILNYFEYIYISFVSIFYFLFFISEYSPNLFSLNVLLSDDKPTNIIFSIIFLFVLYLSFYQLYNGLTFIKLKQQLIIGQEGFEITTQPTNIPTSKFHNIDINKIKKDAAAKAEKAYSDSSAIDAIMNPTTPNPTPTPNPTTFLNDYIPGNILTNNISQMTNMQESTLANNLIQITNMPGNTLANNLIQITNMPGNTLTNNLKQIKSVPIYTPKPTEFFKYLFV